MRLPLSLLDLAPVGSGQSAADSLAACVTLARRAEALGFRRVWYAEHHNIPSIALFGARLAAILGLPYAFASHFAPAALQTAVALYRREFRPSAQAERPHVIAGLNVIAADSSDEARRQAVASERAIARTLLGRGQRLDDATVDALLESPGGQSVREMATYSAVGTPAEVAEYVDRFRAHADADELMISLRSPSIQARLRSLELLAEAMA